MAATVPVPTKSPGDVLTSALWNTFVAGNINKLLNQGHRVLTVAQFGALTGVEDGDEVYLEVDGTNGIQWHLRYHQSTGRWRFLGGPAVVVSGNPNAVINTKSQVGGTGFYYDPTMMSFTVPRAGVYRIQGAQTIGSAGGTAPQWGAVQGFAGAALLGTNYAPNTNQSNAVQQNVSAAWMGQTGSVAASTVVGLAAGAGLPGTWRMYDVAVFITPATIT